MRLFVKICGITSAADARAAAEAGADAVGFVFWPRSPRHVTPDAARRMADVLPPSVLRVGVFVDADREELARAAEDTALDIVQLHGSEAPGDLRGLPCRAWKAVRVGEDFALEHALRYLPYVAGILLDAGTGDAPGGTGRPLDWTAIGDLRARVPFLVLAGGLDPANVAEAVRTVRPHAVDVSTGVESAPGRKDPAKVRAFVEAARSAT